MAELGGGVDEFEFDGFSGLAGRVHQQRLTPGMDREENFTLLLLHPPACRAAGCMSHLSEGENAFLRPHHAALHHDEVAVHFTVVRKPSLEGGVGGGLKA